MTNYCFSRSIPNYCDIPESGDFSPNMSSSTDNFCINQ